MSVQNPNILQHSQRTHEQERSSQKLNERINVITREASRAYFNKILKKLARKNLGNAEIICDYINAEQTEINIKQSTMEGKIKVLTWLSNFHSEKSFRKYTMMKMNKDKK